MTAPTLVFSDAHFHGFSTFAAIGPDGVNSRLRQSLDELVRACDALVAAGGTEVVFCGDLFHTRGSVDPETFNPVHDAILRQLGRGIRFHAIPGNHDLKGKSTTALGNSFQSFGSLKGFEVITEPTLALPAGGAAMAFLPWCATPADLREEALSLAAAARREGKLERCDLFMHAGIDGVLDDMPDHGLGAEEVATWGFRRVFAGDYHNHRILAGGRVMSVGALSHQRFSDIGTLAGWLLVTPEAVEHRQSHTPQFVDVTPEVSSEEAMAWAAAGHFLRVRGLRMTDAEAGALRAEFMEAGAGGVSLQVARPEAEVRGVPVRAVPIAESLASYVDELGLDDAERAAVAAEANDILSMVSGRTAA